MTLRHSASLNQDSSVAASDQIVYNQRSLGKGRGDQGGSPLFAATKESGTGVTPLTRARAGCACHICKSDLIRRLIQVPRFEIFSGVYGLKEFSSAVNNH